jgi:hypothetical protein
MPGLQAGLGGQQVVHAADLEGDVLHPLRCVAVASHGRRVGQLEEGQHVALPGVQEHVHVGIGRLGGRHLVFGNGQHEVHVQVLDVPLDGFLGVLAAVGDVVNAFDLHDGS